MEKIIKQAQDEERTAHAAAVAANPMGKAAFTTQDALQRLNDAEEKHRKAQARVRALIKISTTAE